MKKIYGLFQIDDNACRHEPSTSMLITAAELEECLTMNEAADKLCKIYGNGIDQCCVCAFEINEEFIRDAKSAIIDRLEQDAKLLETLITIS